MPGDQAFRRSGLKGRESEVTYAGATSFLRRNYTREIADADIVVSGIPFDMATSGRPGARLGPRSIRAASVGLAELDAYPFGFDPFDYLAVADYGDCYIDYGHAEEAVPVIEAHCDEILEHGVTMVTLGGDHFHHLANPALPSKEARAALVDLLRRALRHMGRRWQPT